MRTAVRFALLSLLLSALGSAAAQVVPPDPPSGLTQAFSFGRAAGNKPTVSLSWEPSSPHAYLLAGYRVLRRTDKEGAALAPPLAPAVQAPAGISATAAGSAAGLTTAAGAAIPGATATFTSTPTFSFTATPTATLTATPTAVPAAVSGTASIASQALVLPLTGNTPLSAESFSDNTVNIGGRYTYWVQAVDAKGNTSEMSLPLVVDLSHLPDEMLAPDPPANLTSKPGRSQINLEWAAAMSFMDPVSRYLLFRSSEDYAVQANPKEENREVFDIRYSDTPPNLKTVYYYRVKSVDMKGRESDYSNTVSAFSTGTLPPSPPQKLTARIGAEAVTLSWEAAQAGTAPVSEYYIRRLNPKKFGGNWVMMGPKSASLTAYTDKGLEPQEDYSFQVLAVDMEGNTSQPAELAARPERIPFNKTGILLMPTAFSFAQDRDTGANLNVMLSYYIGTLYESYDDPLLNRNKSAILQRINIGTASLDMKYSLIPDTWFSPCLAVGVYTTTLINFSQPSSGSSQTVGLSSGGTGGSDSFRTLGGAYVVASKWLYERAALHLGVMRGNLANDLVGALPPNWELTLRHLTPGGDFPELLTRLVDPSLAAPVETSPHLLFVGLHLPFTLPLYFFNWHTGIKAEYMTPVLARGPVDRLPIMINVHIDNLPLFGFEFSYFKFYQGYEVVGFYHFRDMNW